MKPEVKLINNCQLPSTLVVIGDAHRLTQIIINILSNAIKFTQEGEIVYWADQGRVAEDKVEILFSVSDTGIGMDETTLRRLFRPFSQVSVVQSRVTLIEQFIQFIA